MMRFRTYSVCEIASVALLSVFSDYCTGRPEEVVGGVGVDNLILSLIMTVSGLSGTRLVALKPTLMFNSVKVALNAALNAGRKCHERHPEDKDRSRDKGREQSED